MTEHISPVPREARAYQGQRAGMVTRVAAGAIDAVVVVVVVVVAYLGLNAVALLVRPRSFSFVTVPGQVVIGFALVVAVLYLAGFWAMAGRTYGCHVMGLRIVDRHGGHPGPVVALLRAVLYVAFPVGLLWCAVGSSRRSVQDVVLGTHAIYDWLPRSASEAPAA